jgi:RNA polymerase sigma-70 factor (ECF subfamily)
MMTSVRLNEWALMQTLGDEASVLPSESPTVTREERHSALKTLKLDEFLASVERRAFSLALMGTQHHEQDALDIVQDTMLGFVQYYSDKPEKEWKPLFYRVLNSKTMDFHRRQSVRNRWRLWLDSVRDEQSEQSPEDFHVAFADPLALEGESFVSSQQRLQKLEQRLGELPPRQRQAFLFRCWEGLSTRETADIMNCSEGSVKTHYFRALKALKLALKALR